MKNVESAAAVIAATPADHMFPVPLVVEYLDGNVWQVRFDFFFISPAPDVFPSIGVPRGFTTNFASIPRAFWSLMHPTHAQIGRIAVVHDRFYNSPWIDISREHADMALRAGMEALGARWWKRTICYRFVRLFGGHTFDPREAS